jgi:hypothetical protein
MLRAFAVLIAVTFASIHPVAAQWVEYKPDGGGYSVEMPGEWTSKVEEVDTAIGKLRSPVATVVVGDRAYMTMYTTYPESHIKSRSETAMLDGARDGAVANIEGKLRKEERVVVSNFSGREIIIEAPNGLVLINRFFLMEQTLVQALVAGPTNVENDADTKRFVGSLKALPK